GKHSRAASGAALTAVAAAAAAAAAGAGSPAAAVVATEDKWVQCEHKSCKKWRRLPPHVDISSLPDKWYCNMNTWNCARASCDVPEDSDDAETATVAAAAAAAAATSAAAAARDKDRATALPALTITAPGASASQRGRQRRQRDAALPLLQQQHLAGVPGAAGAAAAAEASSPAAAAASPAAAAVAATDSAAGAALVASPSDKPATAGRAKKNEIKWVQCDRRSCKKWRKLPPGVDPESLPEKWYCSMNTWAPERASCHVPEDEDTVEDDGSGSAKVAASSGGGGGGAPGSVPYVRYNILGPPNKANGRLSYRDIIFGSDGRLKAPFSNPCGAVGSLFAV
ncbi:CW-type zinc finger-domain-containing protein, partial [Tribonema minus]